MIAILAEKPSVARELAALLGAMDKKNGYFEGNGYAVTWALGHLVTLGLPEDYGIKGFQKDKLPILPSPFILVPRKGTGKDRLLPDKGILKQLVTIGELFNKTESIIVATDAGREGELIFRYIYDYLQCKKPFQRLWVSSLTETALRKGFENLYPGSEFDNLYFSARARSRADWLIGINATQALSIAAGSGIYSLGRVQTPTLGLICKKYEECQHYKPEKYWQLELRHTKSFIEFKSTSVSIWEEKALAEEALKSIQRQKQAVVTGINSEILRDSPPLLFDLTNLQKEANMKLGFSASETLDIAQSLYEKQFITYPRTGSSYITPDLWGVIPDLIRGLEADSAFSEALPELKFARLNKHIVNEEKVTDHHGLLITEKVPSALSAKENAIYHMIAFRLLEAVSDTSVREITAFTLEVLHHRFKIMSTKILNAGWRGLQEKFSEEKEAQYEIPELKVDDQLHIMDAVIVEKQHRGPQLYTEAGLLNAMELVIFNTYNPETKERIKGAGLGTPATRAAIIDGLLERQYIERKGKALIPTAKGTAVYGLVAGKAIASVTMTAEWEMALTAIEEGRLDSADFQYETEEYAREISKELLEAEIQKEAVPELLCPKCAMHHLTISEKVVKCPDDKCNWLQWRKVCCKQLSSQEIENLITKKKTSLLKGLKSKSGKVFNAKLVLTDEANVVFEFDNK